MQSTDHREEELQNELGSRKDAGRTKVQKKSGIGERGIREFQDSRDVRLPAYRRGKYESFTDQSCLPWNTSSASSKKFE